MVYGAATDPLGTAWKVGEAIVHIPMLPTKIGIGIGQAAVELSQLSPEQRQGLVDELVAKGHKELLDMPVSVAAEKAGEIVGTIAMEAVLAKGVGAGLKGLSSLKGTAFIGKIEALAQTAKQTIAEVNVPVKVTAQAVVDLNGGVRPVIVTEKKSIGEIVQNMEARAQQVLSGGGKVIDPKIVAEAKEKVGELVKNGDATKLKEYLDQMRNQHGSQISSELKKTVGETIEEIYGSRKTLEVDELLSGHTIEKHVGKSDNWLKQRLLDEPKTELASSYRNKEAANKTIAKFVKENKAEIEEWLKSGEHRFEKDITMEEPIGNVLGRGKGGAPVDKSIETARAWVTIIRDNSSKGWHVETSFPSMPSGKFQY